MKLKVGALFGVLSLLALGVPAIAQPIQYQSADGINNTPVSAAAPLPVTGTFTSGNVAQGSTTSGQTGSLTMCATTTSAPTYTTATTNPCSTDTAGNIRDVEKNSAAILSAAQAGTQTTGSAVPGSAIYVCLNQSGNCVGLTGTANGLKVDGSAVTQPVSGADPCFGSLKSSAPINLTASGQIITGTASKKTYICAIHLVSATAQNVALVEGTGTVCATNIFGLAGGTTAATGWNLAANGGLTLGSGDGTVIWGSGDANATAANGCLLSSSTGQISGTAEYVQQ